MGLVRVRFFGSIHDVVGSAKQEVELADEASIQDLLSTLFSKHGQEFERRIVSPSGKLQAHTRMFVDGREIDYLKLNSPLFVDGQPSADVEFFVIQQSMGG